jgi:hypothetical protein
VKRTGTVEALNVGPRGFYEGFLLKTDQGIVQINLPKEGSFGDFLASGDEVSVEVAAVRAHGERHHPVFRLLRLTNHTEDRRETRNADDHRFSGRVKQLNYSLQGEVNGAILESGEFLYVEPECAREVGLALGMNVTGFGIRKPMIGSHRVIEAEEVNGIIIHHVGAHQKIAKKNNAAGG